MGNNSASDIIEIGIVLSVISVVLLAVMLTLSTGKQLNEVVAETGRKTELAREAKRLSYFDNTEVYGNDISSLLVRDKGKFIVEVELLDGTKYKWDSNSNQEEFVYDEIKKHLVPNSIYESKILRADNHIDVIAYKFKEKIGGV